MLGYGFKHYYDTEVPPGEDDNTIESHQKLLKEIENSTVDHFLIDASMTATFPDRRRRIINSGQSIERIKEVYPCLFDAQEVIYYSLKRVHFIY